MNLATIIDGHPAEAPALLSGDDVLSYGELRRQVAGLRGALVRLGLTPEEAAETLAACGVGPRARPEELGLREFACLATHIAGP